ncbi:MAG: helix-turn-helix domain-containing protein [Firmicutes bacterium]|nr:helix-turn-helix domain-containing protein [Bacillota bacterium]
MDRYITGDVIKKLRESKKLTQEELAGKLFVTSKAISKWETGKGYPDVSLLEPLAEALGISVIELLSGNDVKNANKSANVARSKIYVCPVCGNVIHSLGDAVISCCGVILPALESEEPDEEHRIKVEVVEDEYYVTVDHPMTKDHYISFFAALSDQGVQILKLYPQGPCDGRFKINRVKYLLAYCNRHGLFRVKM